MSLKSLLFFRRDRAIFFIYDHNLLKKEEDDLIDAILYFSPEDVSVSCCSSNSIVGKTGKLSV